MSKKICNLESVPLVLSAKDLVSIGFSRSMVYAMLNRSDFPTIVIGTRKFVRRERLYEWLAAHEAGEVSEYGKQA